jgi:hypothetical protein
MTHSDFEADSWDPAKETHAQWRRRRAREGQQWRRSTMRRIDYYVSEEAAKIIDSLRRPYVGGDYSSILNRVVLEWAERRRSGIK